jgi:hypothetical protein
MSKRGGASGIRNNRVVEALAAAGAYLTNPAADTIAATIAHK